MLASNAARQLHVLGHDGHTLCVNAAKVAVFHQPDQVRLSRLLQRRHGIHLETQRLGGDALGDLAHQALEGRAANEQLRGLLVLADLPQSYSSTLELASCLCYFPWRGGHLSTSALGGTQGQCPFR